MNPKIASAPAQVSRRGQTALLHRARGLTLIEIAVVLVILGSLVGGVLKGQELIQSARVRALIAQQGEIKTAFFAFYDRALPGDYSAASANINCGATPCLNGNGDGRIVGSSGNSSNGNNSHGDGDNGDGDNGDNGNNGNGGQPVVLQEGTLAWTHLSAAGFLNGNFTLASAVSTPDDSNSPKNPYGAYLQILFDSTWGYSTNPALHHNIKTGNLIPVAILAEIDRKVDDGRPGSGSFQFSTYAGSGTAPDVGGTDQQSCTTQDGLTASWNETGGQTNCGAASLL